MGSWYNSLRRQYKRKDFGGDGDWFNCTILLQRRYMVCNLELRKEIWAGDAGIVDIIIDNMLDNIMVVESKGMDGIIQEGCE